MVAAKVSHQQQVCHTLTMRITVVQAVIIHRSYILKGDGGQANSDHEGPHFMLITLFEDSGRESKHWEIVPVATSYNVSNDFCSCKFGFPAGSGNISLISSNIPSP